MDTPVKVCGNCVHWRSEEVGYANHNAVGLARCEIKPPGHFQGSEHTCLRWSLERRAKPQLDKPAIPVKKPPQRRRGERNATKDMF